MKEVLKMKHWLAELVRLLRDSDECNWKTDATSIDLNVEGGKLVVSFDKKDDKYNVFLKGPAEFV
jgi:hypothetical protein